RYASSSRADRAGILDHLAASVAGRAGALDGEEALARSHAAVAGAGRAGPRLGAGLGARAGARLAGRRSRHADRGRLARVGFVEGDLEIGAKVRAALASAAATLAPALVAEERVENVGHELGEIGPEALWASTHVAVEGGVAEPIVGSALVRLLEY